MDLIVILYFKLMPFLFISFSPPVNLLFTGALLAGLLLGVFLPRKPELKFLWTLLLTGLSVVCVAMEVLAVVRMPEIGEGVMAFAAVEWLCLSGLLGLLVCWAARKLWSRLHSQ